MYYTYAIYFLIKDIMKQRSNIEWPNAWKVEGVNRRWPNFPWVDRESWICSMARDKVTFILNIN